jgi:hypothetical protein
VIGRPWTLETYAAAHRANPRKAIRALTPEMAHQLAAVVQQAAASPPDLAGKTALHTPNNRSLPLVWHGVQLIVLPPLALAGWVLNCIPGGLVRVLTPYVVKYDDTITSSAKLIGGFIVIPLGWLLTAITVGLLLDPLWGVAAGGVSPFAGYAALRWREYVRRYRGAGRSTASDSAGSYEHLRTRESPSS